MNRTQQARTHAKRRAFSRLGVRVNRDDMRRLISDIQNNMATHIWAQSNTRSWHLVFFGGVPAVAVYGKNTKTVHTFLTVAQARKTLSSEGQADALARLEAACAS